MLNREIYVKPPESNQLVNNGVAEVSEDYSDAALQVLRYELETFVCDGQYEKGLEKILTTFIRNLGNHAEQPGVWISGFYGSGKSHLAKMLRTLWTDLTFSDGATARSITQLPSSITDLLKELTAASSRYSRLHAAAGKLGAGAGDNVRLALLGVVFKSVGLPEQFAQAQFLMWLKREKLFDKVVANIEAAGRTLTQELPHLYVSPYIAKALLSVYPSFANTEQEARGLLKSQYPQVQDITSDQLIAAITDALSVDGKFPLTLIVLDEVQQYIGDDAHKAFQVQEITETLCKHFSGSLLFVGTGQSALSGSPNLQRLMARFPVPVMLGDYDVENVTRKIILAKKPSVQPEIEKVWRANLGEISRHLRGTQLEHVTDDEVVMTADYPILPVRRRFWEKILRNIDTTGTVSQLRSQLRVVHEAALATADLPLGHVVSGDFLYDQIAASLLSTAQLPNEVFNNVNKFSAAGGTGSQKARLLKLIFLINKLPSEAAIAIGLRATENTLADLLVTDLSAGSSELRKAIPSLLDELQHKDLLVMALDGGNGIEYRLQTTESSAWHDEFRAQEAELKASPQRIEIQRADMFKARMRETLSKVRLAQGKSNEARTLNISFDEVLPTDNAKNLYIWVQDGWQIDEKSMLAEAKSRGVDNPTLFAFIPDQNKTDLANAIVALDAAKNTLIRRGQPNTEPGREAQRSMESRKNIAEKTIQRLLDNVFAGVRLFHAGGQEITQGNDLADKVTQAAKASLVRLYKDFDDADHQGWGKVVEDARKGNTEALKAVGHNQEPEKHPVCQKLLSFIGSGKKGSDIRDNFEKPSYGWSRDAIDGALFALVTTGHLRATDQFGKQVDSKSLDRNKLTQASFRPETVIITTVQLIKIRKLLQEHGIPIQPGDELAKSTQFIIKLKSLAQEAGGAAPSPAEPNQDVINHLEQLSGNSLLLELFNRYDELSALAKTWSDTARRIKQRQPIWLQLNELVGYAKELSVSEGLNAEIQAIIKQRSLLSDPDQVRPLLDHIVDVLRLALNAKLKAYEDEYNSQMSSLSADANWQKLDAKQQAKLMADHHIEAPKNIPLSTPEALAEALDDCNLQRWIERVQALRTRFDYVRLDAAKLLKPNVIQVHLPKRMLNTSEEVKEWLGEVEKLLLENVSKGPVSL
jgi:hypothetical protein